MFLKQIIKKDKQGNKTYTYYRLCESYRIDNQIRHRSLMSLGTLEELSDIERKQLVDCIEANLKHQGELFEEIYSDKINLLAKGFSVEIRSKLQTEIVLKPILKQTAEPDYITVDSKTIDHEDVREIGAEWLCFQTIKELGLDKLFEQQQWQQDQIDLALSQIIAKAVFPASEHKTSQWMDENSGIKEIFQHLPKTMNLNKM